MVYYINTRALEWVFEKNMWRKCNKYRATVTNLMKGGKNEETVGRIVCYIS